MSTPNYSELAERFMHAWQQQLQSMMKDGDFIKQCFDNLQNMANYANVSGHESTKSSAHSAPDALAYELRQLERRLTLVEAELAELKAAGAASAKRVTASTAQPRKKPAGAAPRKRKKT